LAGLLLTVPEPGPDSAGATSGARAGSPASEFKPLI